MSNPWDNAPIVSQLTITSNPWDNAPIVSAQGQPQSWADTAIAAIKNLPSSAANAVMGIGHAITHPMEALDVGAGELQKILPNSVVSAVNSIDPNPDSGQRALNAATAVNNVYKNRYGSLQGFKNDLANDPASILMDAATVASFGGGALSKAGEVSNALDASRLGSALSKSGSILTTAGNAMNPLSFVPSAVSAGASLAKPIAGLGGNLAANILGSPLVTGAGSDAIKTAYNSGLTGNKAFWNNLTGKVPQSDVVEMAKNGLDNMKNSMYDQYRTDMANVAGNSTPLGFSNIDNAVGSAINNTKFDGAIVKQGAYDNLQQVKNAIDDWKSGGDIRSSPMGLDQLKQKIGDIRESIPLEQKTARDAVGDVYNAIKNEIVSAAPEYASTMSNYENSINQINDIKKGLSLGDKVQAETSLRKLQSLVKDNTSESRAALGKALVEGGGNDIMPAIAGQSLNSWTARGMAGHTGDAGTIITAALMHEPTILGAMLARSPKLIGMGAYGAGKVAGIPGVTSGIIPTLTEQGLSNVQKAKALSVILNQLSAPQNQQNE